MKTNRFMHAKAAWLCTLFLGALTFPADAATVRSRDVHITIQDDGSLRQRTRLEVALESRDDVAEWSIYRVYLDKNRELVKADAWAALPGGRRVSVGEDDRDTVEYSGDGILYASRYFHLLRLPMLEPGSVVHVDEEVIFRPYYPASRVVLRGTAPIERLTVKVEGARAGWRHRLDGPHEGLTTEETEGGVIVRGQNLPAWQPPVLAPDGAGRPVLRFGWAHGGWGEDASWSDVGRWYERLTGDVERAPDEVRAKARERIAGLVPQAGPELERQRARLDALAELVEREVRYVAVLIGVEGYRPSPPGEVLARRWGDCKDKSVLLVDLLAEAGIPAYPVLALADGERRLDPSMPSPDQFNHVLVAVPADAVATSPRDPVAGGYLFLDPTQERGTGRWLHPDLQDQLVLVVRPDSYPLVRTPILPESELRWLDVELAIDTEGAARGRAQLELRGELASSFLARTRSQDEAAADEAAHRLLTGLLPGAELGALTRDSGDGSRPALTLSAELTLPGLAQGAPARPSMRLPGMRATPEPHHLTERGVAVALPARSVRATWRLALPESWCPPEPHRTEVDTTVGRFVETLKVDGSTGPTTIVLERATTLRARWVDPADMVALEELANAEHRAHRRRLRPRCGR